MYIGNKEKALVDTHVMLSDILDNITFAFARKNGALRRDIEGRFEYMHFPDRRNRARQRIQSHTKCTPSTLV
jgi:hypothetical protein